MYILSQSCAVTNDGAVKSANRGAGSGGRIFAKVSTAPDKKKFELTLDFGVCKKNSQHPR